MSSATLQIMLTRCSGDHRQGGGKTICDESDNKF